MHLWTAFIIGFFGSLHCAGMCGPLVLAMPATSGRFGVHLTNKTHHDLPVELRLEGVEGKLTMFGGQSIVPREQQIESSVLVEIAPESLTARNTTITVGVYSGDKKLDTVKTTFIGPRK